MDDKEREIKKLFQSKLNEDDKKWSNDIKRKNNDINISPETIKVIVSLAYVLASYTMLFLSYVILDKKINFSITFNYGEGLIIFTSLFLFLFIIKTFLWGK